MIVCVLKVLLLIKGQQKRHWAVELFEQIIGTKELGLWGQCKEWHKHEKLKYKKRVDKDQKTTWN